MADSRRKKIQARQRKLANATKRAAKIAKKARNNIITLDAAETARWQRAASGVRAVWYKEVASKGLDGPKLAAEAEALIAKHSKK